jgi:hypothetical protein
VKGTALPARGTDLSVKEQLCHLKEQICQLKEQLCQLEEQISQLEEQLCQLEEQNPPSKGRAPSVAEASSLKIQKDSNSGCYYFQLINNVVIPLSDRVLPM